MKIFETNTAGLQHIPPTALALGYFDGVHKGHQQVIQAARQYADKNHLQLAVFTFELGQKPGVENSMLQTPAQRAAQLAALGVQYCFQPSFSSFCGLSPQEFFTHMLLQQYHAKALFCGEDFAFGAKRAGNTALLQQLCTQHSIYLQIVPTALYKGKPIGSSRIRAALANGEIGEVNAMLGRPYEIDFPVVHGQQLGSKMGFPTINQIFPKGLQPPKPGVYITKAYADGHWWPSATGYGNRPTVGGHGNTCETFIPGFSGSVYGQQVPVQFYQHIAPSQKFASTDELAHAVQQWAHQATEYFK